MPPHIYTVNLFSPTYTRMPRNPACRNCAEKKVGCRPTPGRAECQRCIAKSLTCEWPNPESFLPPNLAAHRTACDRCRMKRIKCERQEPSAASAIQQCVACAANGVVCAIQGIDVTLTGSSSPHLQGVPDLFPGNPSSQAGPSHTANTTPAETLSGQSGQTATTALRNANRGWWDVVLAPSPPP